MNNIIEMTHSIGQSLWLDSISRQMINSGKIENLIKNGITGITSNPTIFDKAIGESNIYDSSLIEYSKVSQNTDEIFEKLAIEDIKSAAKLLRHIYEASNFNDGYVSIEVSPEYANDAELTIKQAERLWKKIDEPNVMIKVPGTENGMLAVKKLISLGININITLLFSVQQYEKAAMAYLEGLTLYAKSGLGKTSSVCSVASFFISRIDTAVDNLLDENSELRGKIAISNAKIAYDKYKKIFDKNLYGGGSFFPLYSTGAKVQKPLWASTSVKNPSYDKNIYLDNLIGDETINTVPLETFNNFSDSGKPNNSLIEDVEIAYENIKKLSRFGIDFEQVTSKLLQEGIKAFSDSYDALLKKIDVKLSKLKN
ncbi:MAG: transaldolase [Dehalococcoidia bacterium]